MKSDLDALMQEQDVDAILVTGPGDHNPAMVYLTGRSDLTLTNADLIKLRGHPPVLFHANMERSEAARPGLPTKNLADFHLNEVMKQVDGNLLEFQVCRYQMMLKDLGFENVRVALYGKADAGAALAVFTGLQHALPGLSFVSEAGNTLLMQAMGTKDEVEIERIRRVGQVTTQVVANTADFLVGHKVKENTLVHPDGGPLTIGDVKRRINLWLAEAGLENPEGTIFASGADAAIPHNSGSAAEPLRLGQTIIFDIFPCEIGGGYFYDFTRTWCLGYATDEALALYEDVLYVFRTVLSELVPGQSTRQALLRACQLFEERGHPTICSHPQTQDGFVHELGHGVGLNIHERPMFGQNAGPAERLHPGTVITLEPGLYYPEKGMGVRLEDTLWVRPDGRIEPLVEYPYNLVLPVG